MPVGRAPHREMDRDPGAAARAQMCELAVAGDAGLGVLRAELERPGRSYTVDTLRLLRERSPGSGLTLILGADQASELPSWREPEAVLSLAQVAVAARAGIEQEAVRRRVARLDGGESITFFDMPRIDISSSLVRERAGSGRPIRYLVPDRVADYVQAERLYGMPVAAGAQ